MRRVRFHEYGGPEVLKVEEAPAPEPKTGQVLIRTEAIGANFVDVKFRRGGSGIFERPLPAALTGDVAGTVLALGDGVDGVRVGDRVAALSEDAFAEQVVADADWLAPVPDGLDAGAACALPMAGPVALRVLRTGRLAAGETVLVHSAAGGIGHLMVQLARTLGAGKVIATAGSAPKLAFARELGADVAIDYTDDSWPDRIREAAPGGVDVIADAVGGETLLKGLDLLAPFGRTVVFGAASEVFADIPVRSLFAMRQVSGFSLYGWRAARPEEARAEMTEVAGLLSTGRLRCRVHATFPLEQAAKAHRLLDDRAQLGRILIEP